jgi:cell division protein ZapA
LGQVSISIGGKTYRMACDDGQEDHLTALGDRFSQTIEMLRERFGEIGDQRLTVMAAITMADQFSESEKRLKVLERELAGLEEARAALAERQEASEMRLARTVDTLADRLESLAGRLNGGGQA